MRFCPEETSITQVKENDRPGGSTVMNALDIMKMDVQAR